MNKHAKRPFDSLPPMQQAGIMCNDPRFQKFAATRTGAPSDTLTNTGAAEYLRQICGIRSRRELENDHAAQTKFHALRTTFDAWLGKIANQR